MPRLPLTYASCKYDRIEALRAGEVQAEGIDLNVIVFPSGRQIFDRMVGGEEFDASELSASEFISLMGRGDCPFVAIPVFPSRVFRHGYIFVNRRSGIRTPKDLEGRKIGVNRGYTVTTGLWARSVLADEYGVDLKKITFVLSGDEHVAEYRPPANVVPIPPGKTMPDMLASGELAAAIGVEVEHPDVKPLIPDALGAGLAALRQRAHYPINHTVVIRNELIAAHPGLAADIFQAFAESKRRYVELLKAGRIEKPTAIDRLHQRVMEIAGDPLPYGIAPNRKVLEELIRHSLSQGIIEISVAVEELFPAETHGLVG